MSEPIEQDTSTRSKTVKRLGLFKRWYDRYDSWSGRYDWLQWLLSLLKTQAGVAVAGTTAVTVATVGGIAIYQAAQEPPAVVAPQRLGDNSVFFRIEGKDASGRRGTFDVVVLNRDILWARGSSDELEKDGKRLAGDAAKAVVLTTDVRSGLTSAKQVIAVGTASQEGDAAEETSRAERRAKTGAGIVANAVAPQTPVWALNLGQYRDPCKTCESSGTSWQRPFIIIVVRSLEPDATLEEALRDAMTGKPNLPSPSSYSAFALTRVR